MMTMPLDRAFDVDDVTPEELDNYLGAEVLLSKGDRMISGKVVGRKRELDGTLKGTANSNPILDTRTYEVEFPDGDVAEYAANVIAENMYAQCDAEGNQHLLLEAISDHKTDNHAVKQADNFVVTTVKEKYNQGQSSLQGIKRISNGISDVREIDLFSL